MNPDDLRESLKNHKEPLEPQPRAPKNPQELFSWQAPLRAYKRKSTGVLRFYIALALLLTLIAFLFGEKIFILPIWAVVFLTYVLTITPPPKITNKITKFGIETAGQTFRWEDLSHFYFVRRFDYEVLVIIGKPPHNTHIYLVLKGHNIRSTLLELLSKHLVYQETPNKTLTDRMAGVLVSLMPSEDSQVVSSKPEGASL